MIRLITLRRLRSLEASVLAKEAQLTRSLDHELRLRTELELTRQAREHFKAESAKWEARASRFIDQVGISSGIISSPAMAEREDRPPSDVRRVMSVLGQTEIRSPGNPPPSPHSAETMLGVNETAAREAVANALG